MLPLSIYRLTDMAHDVTRVTGNARSRWKSDAVPDLLSGIA